MYLHEFQAKQLLIEYGVPVAPFCMVSSYAELEDAIAVKGLKEAVLKIQVHAGGRGKAGGIRHAKTAKEIKEHGQKLLGMRLVNEQTGSEGIVAEKLLLDTPVVYEKEYYLGVCIDRRLGCASVIASSEGGVEIEEIAKTKGHKISVERIPENQKLHRFQLLRLAKFLGWSAREQEAGIQVIVSCVKAFFDLDAILVEINPLVTTAEGAFFALDAKIHIDDNALFRQERLLSLSDPQQLPSSERRAKEHGLAYVALSGNIGCMVNGAGLAMATMDLIHFWGGEPANFLDVGGGASEDKVIEGFTLLFSEPKVDAILVNIFGGIMNCEIIAQALSQAVLSSGWQKPIVLRMEGTNVTSARRKLQGVSFSITFAESLDEAARLVVAEAKK